MRTFLLLMLLAFPAVGADTVVAVATFNGVHYTLYEEKGGCAEGAKATMSIGDKAKPACWVQKDGYVYFDLNDAVVAVPQVAFTVVLKKTFS